MTSRRFDSTSFSNEAVEGGEGILSLSYSANGRYLFAGSSAGHVYVLDAETSELIHTLDQHTEGVTALVAAQSGERLVSVSYDTTAVVWDTTSFQQHLVFREHESWIRAVALADPSGLVATAGGDKVIRLWDAETGAPLTTYVGHNDWVKELFFYTHDAALFLVSGSFDKTVRSWRLPKEGAEPSTLGALNAANTASVALVHTIGLPSAIRCTALLGSTAAPPALVAGCVDGSVVIVDLAMGNTCTTLLAATVEDATPTNDVAVTSANGTIIAVNSNHKVYLWPRTEGASVDAMWNPSNVIQLSHHSDFVGCLACAPDGACVSADGSGSAFTWNVHDTMREHKSKVPAPSPSSSSSSQGDGDDSDTTSLQGPLEVAKVDGHACLACAATGNDEFTFFACGFQNGCIISLRGQSHEPDEAGEGMDGEDLAPERKRLPTFVSDDVYADWFMKRGGWKKTLGVAITGRKRRLCVLMGLSIKYYEAVDENGEPIGLKGVIRLYKDTRAEVKETRLLLHNPDRTWDLESSSSEQLTRWLARLHTLIASIP